MKEKSAQSAKSANHMWSAIAPSSFLQMTFLAIGEHCNLLLDKLSEIFLPFSIRKRIRRYFSHHGQNSQYIACKFMLMEHYPLFSQFNPDIFS